MGRPLWRVLQRHVKAWRRMGASDFLCRSIQYGIYERPDQAFKQGHGVELGDIPQTKEDLEFAKEDLKKGLATGIYQEVTRIMHGEPWRLGPSSRWRSSSGRRRMESDQDGLWSTCAFSQTTGRRDPCAWKRSPSSQ